MTLQIDETYLLDLASRLVEIPSVSGSEQAIIDFLEQEFCALGLHCHRFPLEPGRDNLLVGAHGVAVSQPAQGRVQSFPPPGRGRKKVGAKGSSGPPPAPPPRRGEELPSVAPVSDRPVESRDDSKREAVQEGPVLCLNAHADTVPPTGRSQPRANAIEGRLYGLGSCDDKGPLAAMAAALLALKDSRLQGRLDLLVTIEEETLGRGARQVIAQGYRCNWAIVAEPTSLQIVPAHAGLVFLRLQAVGKACHGATPEKGENAIEKLFAFIQSLRAQASGAMKPHPLIGSPSLNLGVLRGGDAPNRVADRAEAFVDIRVIPPFTTADVMRLVDQMLARSEWRGITRELRKAGEALSTPTDGSLVGAMKESAAQVTGVNPSIAGLRAWTEAESFQTGLGIEAVVFGPGSVEHAHTEDEFVPVDELVAAARIYANCALRLLGESA